MSTRKTAKTQVFYGNSRNSRPLSEIMTEIVERITPDGMIEMLFPDLLRGKTFYGGITIEYGHKKCGQVTRLVVVDCTTMHWYDFRYGVGGDVFSNPDGTTLTGKSFTEHVIEIARNLGVETGAAETEEERRKREREHRERLARLEALAAEAAEEYAEKKERMRRIAGRIGENFPTYHNNITGNPELKRLLGFRAFPNDLLERFENIGYAETTVFDKTNEVKSIGESWVIKRNSLVFITKDDTGAVVGAKSMQYSEEDGKRTGFAGTYGDFRFELIPNGAAADHVLVCEGETDTIAGALAGFHAVSEKMLNVESLDKSKIYLICLDTDDAGNKETNTLIEKMQNAGLECYDIRSKVLHEEQDLNDVWRDTWNANSGNEDETRTVIHELIENAARAIIPKKEVVFMDKDNPTDEEIIAYCKRKFDDNASLFAKAAYNDDVIGTFMKAVDPYHMRGFAPVFCVLVWGIATLANYRIEADTNPKIVNLVASTSAGKDWILGTLKSPMQSPSLYYQLQKIPGIVLDKSVSIGTGEGRQLEAFNFAKNPDNRGKIYGRFCTECGNTISRGYGYEDRAASIGNYDMALCDRSINKPNAKKDLKELEGYENEYAFNGFEVRAFQNTNAAKVLLTRFEGAGEARREIWIYIPGQWEVLDGLCSDKGLPGFKRMRAKVFTEEQCNAAFEMLSFHGLPLNPTDERFDGVCDDKIKTGFYDSPIAKQVYDTLIDTVQTGLLRQDRGNLIHDRLQFFAGLSAGLHGRRVAEDVDWMIGGYFVECYAKSIDMILSNDETPIDPASVYAKITERIEYGAANGKRIDRDDPQVIERLRGAGSICVFRDKKHKYAVATAYVNDALKAHPDWKRDDA